MRSHRKRSSPACPATSAAVQADAKVAFDELVQFCQTCTLSFARFETRLLVLMAVLGRRLMQLFLTARREQLDVQPFLDDGPYRLGDDCAVRTLKTFYGKVAYRRQYLLARGGGSGFFPLDAVLGLTRDRLSPWVMQWVARLATRLSFKASQLVCKAVLNWAPATETIEQVVLGMGRHAAPFMKQLAVPSGDGDILVIEVDGKCPPMATESELAKRRGPRRPAHEKSCPCGCQRHRGQAKRQARGSKKRRKKGDKSKNGKEAVVVVMYTLRRGSDGKRHGPLNKKLYATFAGRKAAALWARAEATKRGFGPKTRKTVQIVVDGAKGLKHQLAPLFPQAILTVDVCHVVERLWSLGHHFHPEGSAALTAWVNELKTLVYAGRAQALVTRLEKWLRETPQQGPGTKGRRRALEKEIGYLQPRLDMMRVRGVARPRPGDCLGASGRSRAAPGGRAPGLLGDALAARQGRGLAAPAMHRTQRRLAQVRRLVPGQDAPPPETGPTGPGVNGSTPNPAGGRVNPCWETSCTHFISSHSHPLSAAEAVQTALLP